MPSQEEFDKLEGRIVELENALKQRRQDDPDITPEEMETFNKVRDKLAREWAAPCTFRGAELCMPPPILRCIAECHACTRCIFDCFECTCGPCIVRWGSGPGGVGRFGGLGG